MTAMAMLAALVPGEAPDVEPVVRAFIEERGRLPGFAAYQLGMAHEDVVRGLERVHAIVHAVFAERGEEPPEPELDLSAV